MAELHLAELEFRGFKSFAEPQFIDFRKGTKQIPMWYLLAHNRDAEGMDNNGSGKTSILEAVCWALYGMTPSKLLRDSYINHKKDRVYVRLVLRGTFTVEMERWKERGKKSMDFRYRVDNSPTWVHKSLAETQKMFDKNIAGVGFETFCNTIYFTKDSKVSQFLKATPLARSKVLNEIVDNRVWDKAAELVKADRKEAKGTLAALVIQNERDEAQRNTIGHELERLRAELHRKRATAQVIEARVAAQIAEHQAGIRKQQAFLSQKPDTTIENIDTKIEGSRVKLEGLRQAEVEQGFMQGLAHLRPGMNCPTCQREMTNVDSAELEEKIADAKDKHAQVRQWWSDENQRYQSLLKRRALLQEMDRARETARAALNSHHQSILLLEDQLVPEDLSYFVREEQTLTARQEELEARYTKNAIVEIDLNAKVGRMDVWAHAFGREIKDLIFDQVRVALTYYSNNIFRSLFGDQYRIDCPNSHKDEFVIAIHKGKQEQQAEAYSTGELVRFQLGVFLAFGDLFGVSEICPFRFRLIDEFGEGLDKTGQRIIQEMLEDLVEDGKVSTFVVTLPHRELAEGRAQINIIMEDRESNIQ